MVDKALVVVFAICCILTFLSRGKSNGYRSRLVKVYIYQKHRLGFVESTKEEIGSHEFLEEVDTLKKDIRQDRVVKFKEVVVEDTTDAKENRYIDSNPHVEDTLVLERTSDVPYDAVLSGLTDVKKFFIYQPSGGLNNQRIAFESALIIAQKLGRGLIVPMAGKHTSLQAYMGLRMPELVPMDLIFDFDYITDGVLIEKGNPSDCSINSGPYEDMKGRIFPINVTLRRFIESMREQHPAHIFDVGHHLKLYQTDINHCGTDKVLEYMQSKDSKKVLFYKGHFYCHYFMGRIQKSVDKRFRYNGGLRNFALYLMQQTFGMHENSTTLNKFNAIHVRRGDYLKKIGESESTIMKNMANLKFNRKFPVYIATEPTKEISPFKHIMGKYKTFFYRDLHAPSMKAFENCFRSKSEETRLDFFGIIDQLIATCANQFAGTSISTFTKEIVFMRKHDGLFPEIIPDIEEGALNDTAENTMVVLRKEHRFHYPINIRVEQNRIN